MTLFNWHSARLCSERTHVVLFFLYWVLGVVCFSGLAVRALRAECRTGAEEWTTRPPCHTVTQFTVTKFLACPHEIGMWHAMMIRDGTVVGWFPRLNPPPSPPLVRCTGVARISTNLPVCAHSPVEIDPRRGMMVCKHRGYPLPST